MNILSEIDTSRTRTSTLSMPRGLSTLCAGMLVLTASDQAQESNETYQATPAYVFYGATGSSRETGVPAALTSTVAAEGALSHEAATDWVESLLKRDGSEVKPRTMTSSGSYLLSLSDQRSVDVFPAGEVVVAFMEGGKDHIYEFELHDIERVLNTLRHGTAGCGV